MPDSNTPNYDFTQPEVGASDNTWGGKINANFGSIDTLMKAFETSISANTAGIAASMPKAGGNFTGPVSFLAPALAQHPDDDDGAIATITGVESSAFMVQGNGTGPALLALHRVGSFAAYFGLDLDNKLKFGGWSLFPNAYEVFHEGNLVSARIATILGYVPVSPATLAAGYSPLGHTHPYLPLDGSAEVTGEIKRAGQGAHWHWVNDAQDSGRVFYTAEGAADPTSLPGDTWVTY